MNDFINKPTNVEAVLEYNDTKKSITNLTNYKTKVGTIVDGFNTQPIIRSDVFNQVNSAFGDQQYLIGEINYNNGIYSSSVYVMSRTVPAMMISNIIDGDNNFCGFQYSGYSLNPQNEIKNNETVLYTGTSYIFDFALGITGESELGKTNDIGLKESKLEGGAIWN